MNNTLKDLHTSGSLGEKATVFRSGRNNASGFLSAPLIHLRAPLLPPKLQDKAALYKGNRPSMQPPHSYSIGGQRSLQASPQAASKTTGVAGVRKHEKHEEILEASIPNPFPELFTSTVSSVVSECLLPWTKKSKTQVFKRVHQRVLLIQDTQVIKVYNEDDTSRALEVPSDITARDVCQLFILKNHCIDDHSWTLFEHLALIGIERTIEDHESVIEVQSSWGMETDDRLYFRKNYAKYEFFKKPLDFFPEHMVSISSETNGILNHSQLVQAFLNAGSCPEIHGFLHAKEQGKKTWKKIYFVLRRSGLYLSNKGTSKHNQSGGARGLKLLCADEEQIRTCWVTAIRLFKRSISENSLVAMDFSGHKSRVIENPTEALSVAVEEGLSWRLEEDGELFFTLDDGHTRFTDLIQLVEFYQLNKGVLPCKLKHHCARIAL
ncbi:UNVERIFIED_CONTAM: hypothetical protein FKN15_032398 [Acipenser sinensis]